MESKSVWNTGIRQRRIVEQDAHLSVVIPGHQIQEAIVVQITGNQTQRASRDRETFYGKKVESSAVI